ncbi:MAG: amidohydrolase family protein [Candidatus Limnocylindrales bacterium]
MSAALPDRPPFVVRARLVSPLGSGGTLDVGDGRLEVDADGRIAAVGPWTGDAVASSAAPGAAPPRLIDLRPWALLPGLVDLHAHLPQLPNAGLGFGLPLLEWLERYVFPLERAFDAEAAERLAPAAFRSIAAAGTTTAMLYGALWEPSTDRAFRAAEAHGIRAIIGKVMMDRLSYDLDRRTRADTLELSLRQSADLCSRWHRRDGGRLLYAFTPRFAVSCSADMLRESARLADAAGAHWQTHLSEDAGEIAEVARLFPEAVDYLDVYDRAGGLGPRAVLAHAIHLSDREVGRLAETGARVAHCPESNLFLSSGTMPLSRYLAAGIPVGLGSDIAGGPDPSIFRAMRVGAYVQNARRVAGLDGAPILGPLDWLRLGTLDGARALGLEESIGSLEVGKEADLIAVDVSLTDPLAPEASPPGGPSRDPGGSETDLSDPADLLSRLIFRSHPDMVRGAWVRGRRLDGPALTA